MLHDACRRAKEKAGQVRPARTFSLLVGKAKALQIACQAEA
jgi:hypothetical protein